MIRLPGLRVFSASLAYEGPGRLDVTRTGARGLGLAFAPSEALLRPAIAERKLIHAQIGRAKRSGRADLEAKARRREQILWDSYRPSYIAEMRISAGLPPERWGALEQLACQRGVHPNREAWAALADELQDRDERGPLIVFVCWCTGEDRPHCHTRVLCAEILTTLGAVDGGEIGAPGA